MRLTTYAAESRLSEPSYNRCRHIQQIIIQKIVIQEVVIQEIIPSDPGSFVG
jgi:hypothetical protein